MRCLIKCYESNATEIVEDIEARLTARLGRAETAHTLATLRSLYKDNQTEFAALHAGLYLEVQQRDASQDCALLFAALTAVSLAEQVRALRAAHG